MKKFRVNMRAWPIPAQVLATLGGLVLCTSMIPFAILRYIPLKGYR